MNAVIIILSITVIVLGYLILAYNNFQRFLTQIQASIQEIGNQLKRQTSLIPNLEVVVKSYLKHEKGIFQLLADARSSSQKASQSGNMQDVEVAIDKLQTLMPRIAVMVEDNPELKSNESINRFMAELTDTADKLMYARRSLIDLTQNYNEKLLTFPSNLVAKMFGFTAQEGLTTASSGAHLEVSEKETQDHSVTMD